jgi:hypothetical protein
MVLGVIGAQQLNARAPLPSLHCPLNDAYHACEHVLRQHVVRAQRFKQ